MKKILHTYITLWTTCLLLMACCLGACNDAESIVEPDVQLSDKEIGIHPVLDVTHGVTRAFIHDNGNLPQDRMHIETYFDNGSKYFESGMLYEDNYWKFYSDNIKGRRYFWPVNGSLHFFAHFPEQLTGTGMTYAWSNGTPTFTYTGQTTITEDNQKDVKETIFAFLPNCAPTANGQVDLHFHRPFSLVVFKIDQAIRCTIASIKITNIYNNGTATCHSAANADGTYAAWATQGSNDNSIEVDYSQMDAYSTNGGIRYPEDINSDAELALPFVVVPQTLTDEVLLEVRYASESGHFTTVKSRLSKATLAEANTSAPIGATVDTWKPGNRYTYSLMLNGAADEIFVGVRVTDWIPEGETEIEVH